MNNLLGRFARLHPITKSIIGIGLAYAIGMQVLSWQESPQVTKIVATKDIQVGSTISSDDLIELINAPVGDKELGSLPLFVNSKAKVVGRSAKRRIPAGSVVTQEDIEPQ